VAPRSRRRFDRYGVAVIRAARRNPTAEALAAGIALGVIAQVLRQVQGESMQFGGATAPWLTVGFALAVWAARRRAAGRVLVVYLVGWLVAYHVLFALGQSVSFAAAFREALPWLVLTLPVCAVLTPVAALARRRGIVGDLCLAAPIAWSFPETVENAQRGDVVVALAIAVLAVLPIAAAGRRGIRIATVLVAALAFGALALAAGPIARSFIHS
jgi:hypothetical protein